MAFENVNFGLLKPSVALESPMDIAMKGTQIQGAQQQLQTGALQQQQLQQQIKDAQDLRNIFQTAGQGATSQDEAQAKVAQALMQSGNPLAQTYFQKMQELKLKGVELSQKQQELATKHSQAMGQDLLATANAPGATPDAVASRIMFHVKQGNIPQAEGQEMLKSLPSDPTALGAWGNFQAAKAQVAPDVLKLFTGETKLQDTGTGFVPVNTNQMTGQTTFPQGKENVLDKDIGPGDLKKFASDIGALKPDGSIDMTNPDVQAKKRAMTTNMAMILGGQGGGGNFNPSEPLPDAGMEAVAQAIARGAQAPQEYSIRNPAGKIINARAAMIGNGDLQGKTEVAAHGADLSSFAAGGKNGQTINALNTMTEHLGTMEKAIGALNLGNIPLANKIGQAVGVQFGDDAPTNAQVIKDFLSGEVAKVATGGHLTEGEIGKAESSIKTAGSPAQAMGALGMMREIAGGKLTALNQDYQRITGKNLVEGGRLTPATAAAFKDVFAKQNAAPTPDVSKPYAGKTLPMATFNSLSGDDQKKFIAGGGRPL